MKNKHPLQIVSLAAAVFLAAAGAASAQQSGSDNPLAAEVMKTAKGFIEAFHKGDAQALAACWLPEGDYVDDTGRVFKGRKAIQDSFTELFAANKGLSLRIEVASLKFPTPDTAIEDGTTTVIPPDGSAPSRARYTNVLVKKDGQWLLASVRESADAGPSNYEFLRGLEWLVGEWVDEALSGEVGHVSFAWAAGQNFIVSSRTVEYKDASLPQSTQWIGWDPTAKKIRSWSFHADGGFGESTWSKDGDKWVIKTESVLADGSKVTSTNVVTSAGHDTLVWQSRDQKVNGQPLPDTKEVKMKRVP